MWPTPLCLLSPNSCKHVGTALGRCTHRARLWSVSTRTRWEDCAGLGSDACRARCEGLPRAAGQEVPQATGLQQRQSRATRLLAAGLPLVPSHPAFAKAVDNQWRGAEFRRSPWGFPPPFFNLTLNRKANLHTRFLWGASALPAHPPVPVIHPGSLLCSDALPAHIQRSSNESRTPSAFGSISVAFTSLQCLTS